MATDTQVKETPIDFKHHLVKEDPTDYNKQEPTTEKSRPPIKHDLLMKQLITTFFEEFVEAFFPEVHHHVDFTGIRPLPGEVFTDLIDGQTRRLDIVVEATLKGEETVLIIHVEPQSYKETNFHERMYHYFSLLYNKYRKPILPIAVFSYDENRCEKDEFSIGFPFFHVLTFNFLMLELRKKNWRDYIKSDNPAAAALLSKMGYTEEEKVEVKKEFLKMLVRMDINPAEYRLLNAFFEVYLPLNEEEEEQLMKEIQHLDNMDEILELPNSWEERGIKRGKEEGKEEAMEKAAIAMLKKELPLDLIADVTGLEKEKIEKLKMTL